MIYKISWDSVHQYCYNPTLESRKWIYNLLQVVHITFSLFKKCVNINDNSTSFLLLRIFVNPCNCTWNGTDLINGIIIEPRFTNVYYFCPSIRQQKYFLIGDAVVIFLYYFMNTVHILLINVIQMKHRTFVFHLVKKTGTHFAIFFSIELAMIAAKLKMQH